MREDKKIKKEQQPSSFYSNIFLLPIIFGIIVIMAMKYNPFKMEEVSTLKINMRRQHVFHQFYLPQFNNETKDFHKNIVL